MKLQVFSIRDEKAAAFHQPFFLPSAAVAIRAFGDVCSDTKSSIFQHPEDYRLYTLGEYDDQTGVITPLLPVPAYLAAAVDFLTKFEPIPQDPK